jgi:hypothetical protein
LTRLCLAHQDLQDLLFFTIYSVRLEKRPEESASGQFAIQTQ